MRPELKEFIKSHLDLIDNEQYEELYREHRFDFWGRVLDGLSSPRLLTEFLLSCSLNPLEHVERVPRAYLQGSTMESVDLPEGIKVIDEYAFSNMNKLSEITIPESCEVVERGAFECCKELTTVRIKNKNTQFGDKVFYLCFILLDMYYPGSVNQFREHMPKNTAQIYTVHCSDGDYIVAGKDEIYSA